MNFQGFSPDSFEQFIRAVALKVIGPGVTLFGNGPDGGREATFRGKVNFPFPPSDTWDGYGVIQAKFKEKTETTQKDQTWAARQLQSELSRWARRRTLKPDYIIFCTNVELSSAEGGGKATLERIFEERQSRLRLKGYAIWDANQLVGYVDGFEEIRRRFVCYFTPGDLLAEFANALSRIPDPDSVLNTYLSREILADEDARLSQAGDRSEDRIKLASVFIDLPVADSFSTEPPSENSEEEMLPQASLHRLLRASACKLDPLALKEQAQEYKGLPLDSGRIVGRFVFLGGPGSGKSTIGQFLSQIHRAALLDRRPSHRLEPNVVKVIKDMRLRCEEEAAAWPTTPRYPFRVELNAFAKALAAGAGTNGGVATLSDYLRGLLSRDVALSHDDLRDWLRKFPWLLVLDGLDEVPASSNRREVVAAIQGFLNEARDVEADLMIVGTSRLDGYAGEFGEDEVSQLYLLPLSKARSLACAKRYVTAKTSSRNDRRAEEAMAILEGAIENSLVEKLMRSPLQVTFMVTVVAASGKPSESRWQLFNDYYRTIYERELHKAVRPFDKVLNERRQDIDALHHRAGFILQCRAEASGGTQADLSVDEFGELVRSCLKENGLCGQELHEQSQMILGAANQRLVFLTSRAVGRLSFDVRSLQEYMAAASITNGDSGENIERLEAIAHSSYWRNTFLFAFGRFFVEPHMRDRRDRIRVLCDDLNRKDSWRVAAKLGSRLALEILESGIVGNVPLVSRNLASCALALLSNPPSDKDDVALRMSQVYEPTMQKEFEEEIALRLGQKDIVLSLLAWMLVLFLEKREVEWARKLAESKWPTSHSEALVVLSTWLDNHARAPRRGARLDKVDVQRLTRLVLVCSPQEFSSNLAGIGMKLELNTPGWLRGLLQFWNGEKTSEALLHVDGGPSNLSIRFNSMPTPPEMDAIRLVKQMENETELHPDWSQLLSIGNFLLNPNGETLSKSLAFFADSVEPECWRFWGRRVPWPLACCLNSASSSKELKNLSTQAGAGLTGDTRAWQMKEEAWKGVGITLDELRGKSFASDAVLGAGARGLTFSLTDCGGSERTTKSLVSALCCESDIRAKEVIAWLLPFYASTARTTNSIDPAQLVTHLIPSRKDWTPNDILLSREEARGNEAAWVDFFDKVGRLSGLSYVRTNWRLEEAPVDWLFEEFLADRGRVGLLRLVGFWCASGRHVANVASDISSLHESGESSTLLAALLVQLSRSETDRNNASLIYSRLLTAIGEGSSRSFNSIILAAIERHAQQIPSLAMILPTIISAIPVNDWDLRGRGEWLRNGFLQATFSGLDERLLRHLKLPLVERPLE